MFKIQLNNNNNKIDVFKNMTKVISPGLSYMYLFSDTMPDPRIVFIGHDPLLLNYGYNVNEGHSNKKVKDRTSKIISKRDHPDTGEVKTII